MRYTIISILLITLLVSCSSPKKSVQIDNQSSEPVTLTFNSLDTIMIPGNSLVQREIPFGSTRIQVNDMNPEIVELDPKKEYLISPFKNTYYLETMYYLLNPADSTKFKREFGTMKSEIDGVNVEGVYDEISHKIAIPVKWHYGLEDYPSEDIYMNQRASNNYYVERRKLHRDYTLKFSMKLREMLPAGF